MRLALIAPRLASAADRPGRAQTAICNWLARDAQLMAGAVLPAKSPGMGAF